jgi:hypothetical protein
LNSSSSVTAIRAACIVTEMWLLGDTISVDKAALDAAANGGMVRAKGSAKIHHVNLIVAATVTLKGQL